MFDFSSVTLAANQYPGFEEDALKDIADPIDFFSTQPVSQADKWTA